MIFGRGELFIQAPDGSMRRVGTVNAIRFPEHDADGQVLPPSPDEISHEFKMGPRQMARVFRVFGFPPKRYPFKRARAPGWRRP